MKTNPRRLILFVYSLAIVWPILSQAAGLDLDQRLNQGPVIQGELLKKTSLVKDYYKGRGMRALWISKTKVNKQARDLIDFLENSDHEGLRGNDYHLSLIKLILKEKGPLGDLEILLTDAFFAVASDLSVGRLSPRILGAYLKARSTVPDLKQLLDQAISSKDIRKNLEIVAAQHPGYSGLRKALALYRQMAAKGGWKMIPPGSKLDRGDQGPRVLALRKRLQVTGDLGRQSVGDRFDASLEEGLKHFQKRHGLEEDGKMGRQTLAALNVPVENRIRQLELNMESRRWLPIELSKNRVTVNIPDFRLKTFEEGKLSSEMKVVVGQKKDWQTPVLSSRVTNLVLNPKWHVPPGIIKKEMIEKLQKDPGYFAQNDMMVMQVSNGQSTVVDPMIVDWAKADTEDIRIVQRPGSGNALGKIKFIFPNPFAIYLHDTPQQEGFKKQVRALSHGCIRVEKPMDLAKFLLQNNSSWSFERLINELKTKEDTEGVPLKTPVDLYVLYWTAWMDEGGLVHFRDDIYGIDKKLDSAMSHLN